MKRGVSSDDSPGRVTPDLLFGLVREADVSTLHVWDGNPWDWDVGQSTVMSTVFGQLRLPVVLDGEVIYGVDQVEAERVEPKDGGRVLVIDLSSLGWPAEKARAWALGQLTQDRTAYADQTLLAELVASIRQFDVQLADAAGWTAEAFDDLLTASRQIGGGPADPANDPYAEYASMPEHEEGVVTVHRMMVHFASLDDLARFADLTGIEPSESGKVTSSWWPPRTPTKSVDYEFVPAGGE